MKKLAVPAVICLAFIAGCGDSAGNYTQLTTTVSNFFVALDELQVIQGGAATGSATAELTLDLDDLDITGSVTLDGLDAETVTLKSAFAGETGPVVSSFIQDSATQWSLPDLLVLSATEFDALTEAGLYLEVTTLANAEGAVRAQITPDGIEIFFNPLTGSQVVPGVSTTATAESAVTVNVASESITVHLNTLNLANATSATINQAPLGANGSMIINLVQDALDPAHWFIQDLTLTQAQYAAFRNEELYFIVTTPAQPAGEVRGQILLSDGILPTLSSIQDKILTPGCATAGCHKGKVPSQGLDLTQGMSFANMVNVDSVQRPGIALVAPGDADNSYLIQKIEGTAASGGIMPVRGGPLTANQILTIRQWIDGGALDN